MGNLVDVGKVSPQLKLQRRQQTSLDVILSPICLVRALSAVRMVATGVVGAYLATELAIAWREESATFEAVQGHPEEIRHLAMRMPHPIDKNFWPFAVYCGVTLEKRVSFRSNYIHGRQTQKGGFYPWIQEACSLVL